MYPARQLFLLQQKRLISPWTSGMYSFVTAVNQPLNSWNVPAAIVMFGMFGMFA
jgi:hypothetical protein